MPITDKTYTTHCCHFLCIQSVRFQPSSQQRSGVWGNKDGLFSNAYELNTARWFWKECRAFPLLMWACVQCVDVLKQIAGDDRDTEHQLRAPSHYSQIQVTQKYTHTHTHTHTQRLFVATEVTSWRSWPPRAEHLKTFSVLCVYELTTKISIILFMCCFVSENCNCSSAIRLSSSSHPSTAPPAAGFTHVQLRQDM